MSATVNLTVSLDFDDETEARAYAMAHAPLLDHWRDYPAVMRDAWRARMGSGWRAQLALPPALEGLSIDLSAPAPMPPEDGANWRLPERDERPPDPPPVPRLPPAPAMAGPTTAPPRYKRAGFLAAASQLAGGK
jgi:hypothetical protein